MFKGMGGPGAGHINGLKAYPGLADSLSLNSAAGYGLGVYGYPLAYGISPWGQQARMLNNQWPGLPGIVREYAPARNLPSWFTFRPDRTGP